LVFAWLKPNFKFSVGKCLFADAYAKSLLQFSLAERKTVVKPIHLPQFYFVGTSTMVQQDEGVHNVCRKAQ
jgi:hypothetical protein